MGLFDIFKKKTVLPNVDAAIKKEFYLRTEKYFKNGFLKEIYVCDMFSICNAVNNCYIIFDFETCNRNETPLGIVVEQNLLKSIMTNNMAFYNWLSNMSDEEMMKRTVVCSDKVFELMKEEKQRTDKDGPDINLDYEKMLIEEFQKSN